MLQPVVPVVKRGTHVRVGCMDRVVKVIFGVYSHNNTSNDTNDNGVLQVVVVGAGKDTTFFRYYPEVR